ALTATSIATAKATMTDSYPVSGNHQIAATYLAGPGFVNGSSNAYPVTVVAGLGLGTTTTTQTGVTASSNPAYVNQAVTFTATVINYGPGGTPQGKIQFVVDGASYGTPVILVSGKATSTASYSSAGGHQVRAVFSPDPGFGPSTSAVFPETVLAPQLA